MTHRTNIALAIASALGLAWANSASSAELQPALGGYCPVAYAFDKAVEGDPAIRSTLDGELYLFASEDAKGLFDANPSSYAIAYDGWCATGVALGKKIPVDPTVFLHRDGTTYLFSNEQAKVAFEEDLEGMIAAADAEWPRLR